MFCLFVCFIKRKFMKFSIQFCLFHLKIGHSVLIIWLLLGLRIYGYLCTRVRYVISGRILGYPHHLGLRRNWRFLPQKQDRNKICRNSHISESEMYQTQKLHPIWFWFCYIFIFILFSHYRRFFTWHHINPTLAGHHIHDHHVGFFFAWSSIGKHNLMSRNFSLICSYHDT